MNEDADLKRKMAEVADLTEHLKTLQIYKIFKDCSKDEQVNLTALQFMCILDYHTNDSNLYTRINEVQQPKLLGQLLQFKKFETFKYFHYAVSNIYSSYLLKCRYCELVGPSGCILTHMTINHHAHIGVVKCIFCNEKKLEQHLEDNSLTRCYKNYIQKNKIVMNENVCGIVAHFYKMLKILSEKIKRCSTHRKDYQGMGYKSKETLLKNYGDDISQECEVRDMIPKNEQNRSIRSVEFNLEFVRIMEISRGGGYKRKKYSDILEANVIVISDNYEEDEEVNHITNVSDMIPENLIKRELSVSPFTMTLGSTSKSKDRRLSPLSTSTPIIRTCSDLSLRNESKELAMNIARELERIPRGKIREQLVIKIELAINEAEKQILNENYERLNDFERFRMPMNSTSVQNDRRFSRISTCTSIFRPSYETKKKTIPKVDVHHDDEQT